MALVTRIRHVSYSCVNNFMSTPRLCKYFSKLTNHANKTHKDTLNDYWKMQANLLCSDIDPTYKTNEWFEFYQELIHYFESAGHATKDINNAIHSKTPIALNDIKENKQHSYDYRYGFVTISPLLKACEYDCIQIVKMLANGDNEYDLNKAICVLETMMDDYFEVPLCTAIAHDSKKTLSYLLSLPDIDLFCKAGDGLNEYTPLMQVARSNDFELAKKLLSHPNMTLDNINFVNMMIEGALWNACNGNNKEVAMLLIENGANMYQLFGQGYGVSLLYTASLQGLEWLANILINSQNDKNYVNECEKGHGKHKVQNNDYTCLMAAAEHGHLGMVKILLKNNCNSVFASGMSKYTAFMYAAKNGHADILEYIYNFLIKNVNNKDSCLGLYDQSVINEYVNRKNDDGNSALMLAKAGFKDKKMDAKQFETTIRTLVDVCQVDENMKQ